MQKEGLSCPTQPSRRRRPRESRLLQGWRLMAERSRAAGKSWWPCGLFRGKSYLGNILQTLASYFPLKSLPLSPAPKHSPLSGSKWLLPTPTIHSWGTHHFQRQPSGLGKEFESSENWRLHRTKLKEPSGQRLVLGIIALSQKIQKICYLPSALYQDSPHSPAPPGLQDQTPTTERVKE